MLTPKGYEKQDNSLKANSDLLEDLFWLSLKNK